MTGEPPAEAGDTELTLLRAQNQQLETRLREARESADQRLIHVELKAEAIRAGMVDLDGLKLISAGDVNIDEHGDVCGAAASIDRMQREKPWLFGSRSSSSAASAPSHSLSRPKLATEMTLDEWRAARAELVRQR